LSERKAHFIGKFTIEIWFTDDMDFACFRKGSSVCIAGHVMKWQRSFDAHALRHPAAQWHGIGSARLPP
jgi:hypothetical protein